MKKIIFPILVLNTLIGYSQTELYKGNSKGVDVYLTTSGNKYVVGTSLGTLNNVNGENVITGYNSPIQLSVVTGNSNDIEVNFSCKTYEYLDGKFKIAYTDAKGKLQYVDVVISQEQLDIIDESPVKYKIPKTSNLYVIVNYDSANATQFQYQLPNNTIEVNASVLNGSYYDSKSKLNVDINKDKSIIKISENGNDEIIFTKDFDTTGYINEHVLQPTASEQIKSTYKVDPDVSVYNSEFEVDYNVKIFKTIDQGLKNIKKESYKYVVVIIENLDQSTSIDFKAITESYKAVIGQQIYYKNLDEFETNKDVPDNFIFVKASEKDKKWLQKKGFDLKTPKILFVDKNENVLKYSSNNEIESYNINYSLDNSIDGYPVLVGLENINNLYQKIQKGKIKPSESIELLKKINLNLVSSQATYSPEVNQDNPVIEGEEGSDYYNYVPDFKFNFPNFSEQKLDDIYNAILDESAIKFNPEITFIIENELRNSGFSAVLFNKSSSKPFTKTDIKAINLLIKNSDKVVDFKNKFNTKINNSEVNINDLGYNFYDNFDTTFDSAILEAINSQLYNFSDENYLSKDIQPEIINIIKSLIKKQPDKITYLTRYYDVLTNGSNNVDFVNTDFSDLFILFDNYLNEQFKSNASVIEVLDEKFSNLTATDKNFFFDWVGYKTTHANLANNLAWAIVEKRDKPKYELAKKWVDFSVSLDKFSSYNLDTLAHIYYLTGNVNKAIEVQLKAIEMAKHNGDVDSEQSATQVLSKMKNKSL